MGTIISLLVLSFLIFFHELGHFIAARIFGVKVEVFSIGFGKKLVTKVYKGTQYCISAIPLGGYVQMKGQDDTDPTKRSLDTDSYNTKAPWKRIIILFAGPFANFLLAFLLYIAIANIGVMRFAPIIGEISKNSAAQAIGLEKGDKILQINNQDVKTWDDVSKYIKTSTGALHLVFQRKNQVYRQDVTPQIKTLQNIFGENVQKRILGISPQGDTLTLHYNFSDSINFAFMQTKEATFMIVKSLQKLLEGIIPAKDLGGIIQIVQVTSQASEAGIISLFGLTALISVNLGVLNLLPIPALDGGHIMFNAYEMITRKAPSEKILYIMTVAGWILLLSLMVFTVFNDIYRIVGGN
jgi:regulator of sigma E protease